MADAAPVKRRGRPPKAGAGDGDNGELATEQLAETENEGDGMDWSGLNELLKDKESSGANIVRVWHPDAPGRWFGDNIDAPCEIGKPAYQVSSGQIVEVE